MDKPELNEDILALLETFGRHHGPEVIKVSARRLNKAGVDETYDICSRCYSFIEQTWDHKDWCELYEAEKLSEWLKKGKNEK